MNDSKKEIIRKLKIRYQYEKSQDEKRVINIHINDENTILSPFSSSKPIISKEFAEYLSTKLTPVTTKKGVHINISCSTIEDSEKEMYISAIKDYYEELYISQLHEAKRLNLISSILLIVGVFVLIVSIVLDYKYSNPISSAVYDIVAWVFIWEATDIFFFQKSKIRHEKRKCLAMMQSTIKFENEKK